MAKPAGKRLPPERAAACRRAAALHTHWGRKDSGEDGEMAIFGELETEEDWFNLVCALLNMSEGIVKAAREGLEEEYVAHVLREAMVDEVAGG